MNTVLVFPGQGSQYVGMGAKLYEEYEIVRQTFHEADDYLGRNISEIIVEGSAMKLNRLNNLFPAIFTTSVALFRLYMSKVGIKPMYLAGHSLGEYSALCCSGALEFGETLRFVEQRGELIKKVHDPLRGAMTILDGVTQEIVSNAIIKGKFDGIYIACYNAPTQIVVSGLQEQLFEFEQLMIQKGGRVTPLIMSPPIHSRLVSEVEGEIERIIEQLQVKEMKYPVISSISGKLYSSKDQIKPLLKQQICHPVQWQNVMRFIKEQHTDLILEIGTNSILTKLTELNVEEMKAYSYGNEQDRSFLYQFLSLGITEETLSQFVIECMRNIVCTRNNSTLGEICNKEISRNYRSLENILASEHKDMEENRKIAVEVYHTLKRSLEMKEVVESEKKMRLNNIISRFNLEELFDR